MAEIVQLWLMFGAGYVTGWFLRDAKASRSESQLYRKLTAKWYDDEIAPALAEIAEKCRKEGVPMVAVVEYEPGERGSTLLVNA